MKFTFRKSGALTLKNSYVLPSLFIPKSALHFGCLNPLQPAKSSKLEITCPVLLAVRKAAKFAVYDAETIIKQKNLPKTYRFLPDKFKVSTNTMYLPPKCCGQTKWYRSENTVHSNESGHICYRVC